MLIDCWGVRLDPGMLVVILSCNVVTTHQISSYNCVTKKVKLVEGKLSFKE